MTLIDALIAELDPEHLEQLAAKLQPYLEPAGEDGWLRGAAEIGAYIGAPRSRVFALSSAGRIPVHRDGTALCARKSELDTWVRAGGSRRP